MGGEPGPILDSMVESAVHGALGLLKSLLPAPSPRAWNPPTLTQRGGAINNGITFFFPAESLQPDSGIFFSPTETA